ncbi:hypothetical protein [Leptothoe spongobia]|uniref:Uncharacterized protein n=1 Tax=Leptothoe spongobia TAU-MAC 1115 TaxID=1967444 RepID=A0A947DDC2_9CYAN|nr:hypothetical protein [Leptothoe spongobia]MBT9314790.1 hypothetical protein [Leptothoe spongobia TAU-MAC 1115]
MRYWEFLIQQEGDQTWLPLETRQVEILEGRYRMAAYTSYDETSVEVRVSQLLLDEIPPRRRVRKRKSITNDSGLLAIFPFMQLSPGRWEIDCNSPDVIDDFLGDSWHYSVQLQVTPRDEDDWELDWSEATADNDLPELAELEPTEPPPATDLTLEGAAESVQSTEFQLELKQQAYVTELGKTLTLTGHLAQTTGRSLSSKQLWVELRDPQTASILKERSFELPTQSLPSPFSVTITLPEELSTQVILGAVSLRSKAEKDALALASFTVTIGLAQMLDAIANQPDLEFEEEISIFPGSTESFVPPPEKTEALITRETPIIPRELIPSEGLTLPPQIKPPSELDEDIDRQPELPEFPTKLDIDHQGQDTPAAETIAPANQELPAEELPVEALLDENELFEDVLTDERPAMGLVDELPIETLKTPDETLETSILSEPDIAPEDEPGADEQQPFSAPKVFELGSIEDDDLDLELANAAQDDLDDDLEPEPLPSPNFSLNAGSAYRPKTTDHQWDKGTIHIDRDFQNLQLRDRFWKKLNLLTQEGYRESLEVKRALKTSDTLPEGNRQSNEFVAYEPRPQRLEQKLEQAAKKPTNDSQEPIQVLPPTLDVPMQELVAGEWIAIKVRLPVANYHPYVKVWMNDLQTRTIIEAPRMLMQFTPNDYNELETLMRVQVPTGCLELQIAAISVDMSTLQESRKVVQNRRVMPPDNTVSLFDDWDM